MTVREELHTLVDRLSDDTAVDVLAYVRQLAQEPWNHTKTAQDRLVHHMGPSAVAGTAFFTQPPTDLDTLATQQEVRTVTNFDDLLVDIWPEDENLDVFLTTLHQWRHESDHD